MSLQFLVLDDQDRVFTIHADQAPGSDRFQQNCNSINMDGHDSIMGSDTEAHSGSTPQPLVSNNANMGPPKRKNRSNRSAMWDHFTPMPRVEGVKAANCNYCKTRIQYSGGTSAMRAHLTRCNLYPPNMMMHESDSSSLGNREVVVNSSPAVPKFDQEVSRIDLVNMFVALELPFQKVEHPYFRKFVYGLQPKFMLPSRTTLAREILKNWDMEKAKLKSFLSQHCRRVCLTTDTWTSTQNFNYMCLTAHFIDNNWKLQKKVLNFMQVTEYTGEIMAKTVKECLNGWELGRVLSVTVDNASSNDVGIRHLKRWLLSQNGLVSNGEHLHTRCCAHILNLIVKDELTIVNESILRIRSAVRYVRRTPSRFQRFKKCIDRETITFKGYVGLDCETRWNATYTMANSAFKHMKTFIELEFTDQQYVNEMRKDKGVPTLKDWEEIGSILPFLKIFHDATVRVSGSSYLTSNLYMLEVFSVGQKIAKMCCSEDASLKSMALKMRAKYNKYWGDPNSLNMFLLIAMVLDPRRKLKLVDWMARRIYSSAEAESLTKKIESFLKSIYEEYSGGGVSRLGNYGNVAGVLNEAEDPYELCDFYESDECNTSATELQKYLINENVEEDRPDFDLLEWWKINSSRLPILASIARDVLAIPISTVASESTFSTGGRVLDPYRSSLTPRTVEALICTQDWLDAPFTCFLSSEDLDVIEKIEEDLLSTQDAPSCSASTSITLDDA